MELGLTHSGDWYLAACALILVASLAAAVWRRTRDARGHEMVVRKAKDPLLEGAQGHAGPLPEALGRPLRQAYKKFLRHGQFKAAAGILETAGLVNEAAYLLAQQDHVDDAVAIMLRINNLVGAGAIYARSERWAEAAEMYARGGAHADAGQAYLRMNDLETAAGHFEQAGLVDEAVRAYLQAERFDTAIRLQLKAKDYQGARHTMLFYAYKDEAAFVAREFSREEFFIIRQEILNGHLVTGFVRAYERHFGLGEIILSFMKNETLDKATVLYQSFKNEGLDRYLFDNVCYWDGTGVYLGEFFTRNGSHRAAAVAFARSQNFAKASQAHERAGDLRLALESALEAQDWERADLLRERMKIGESPVEAAPTPASAAATPPAPARPDQGMERGTPAFRMADADKSRYAIQVDTGSGSPAAAPQSGGDFILEDAEQEAMIEIKPVTE